MAQLIAFLPMLLGGSNAASPPDVLIPVAIFGGLVVVALTLNKKTPRYTNANVYTPPLRQTGG
jgi:hypothetical protein